MRRARSVDGRLSTYNDARSMIGSSNHVHCTRSDWFEFELLLLVKVIFLASSKPKGVKISFSGITSETKCFQRGSWGAKELCEKRSF